MGRRSRLSELAEQPSDEELFEGPHLLKMSVPEQTIEAIDWSDPATFGEPIHFGEVRVSEISLDFLPVVFRDYAQAVSDFTQTPPEAVSLLMLAVLAAALQKKFVVAPYDDDYVEPLSIWILVILFSGERKTAILKALCSPLAEWERQKAADMRLVIEEVKTKREIAEGRIKSLTQAAIKAKERAKREEIENTIKATRDEMPEEKSAPQVFTSNTTPEALEDLLTENGEAMAVISDEADSLIEIMTGLYSNGRANLDVFLKGHAGSPHKVARQKRKALLEAPSVTMGLTAQPDVLERLSGDGRKHRLRGVGLLARFLFCTPKPMVGKRIPRERKSIDSLVKARYYRGVADLLNYPRPAAPVRLIFSAKAKESWLKFQEHLEPKMAPFAELGDMSDWASKTTGCVVRIAGLLHIGDQITGALSTKSASSLEETSQHSHTDSVRGEIGETIVDQAIKLIISLIGHAAKALDTASNDGAAADAKWVLGWVAKNAKQNDKGAWFFKENDLHKSSRFKNFKRERLDKALAVLEMGERNMISKQYKLNTRKPTLIRYCNPAVFQKLP